MLNFAQTPLCRGGCLVAGMTPLVLWLFLKLRLLGNLTAELWGFDGTFYSGVWLLGRGRYARGLASFLTYDNTYVKNKQGQI